MRRTELRSAIDGLGDAALCFRCLRDFIELLSGLLPSEDTLPSCPCYVLVGTYVDEKNNK